MSPLRARRGSIALIVVLAAAAALLSSAGALAAPAWQISSVANTTAAPGTPLTYITQIANIGDATTGLGEPYIVQATLPPGLSAVSVSTSAGSSGWACTITPSLVTCTNPANTPSRQVRAHKFAVLNFTVNVDSLAAGTLTSEFDVSGGGAATTAATVDPTLISTTPFGFGVDAFDGQVASNAAEDPFTQAGGHPYSASTEVDFDTVTNPNPRIGPTWPVEPTKDVAVDLPPGFIGNPTAADKCTAPELANSEGIAAKSLCSPTSQVGTALVRVNSAFGRNVLGPVPVFAMVPPPGVAARFGINIFGTVVTLDARVRSGSDYGISVDARNVSQGVAVVGTTLTLWGVPSDSSHDTERACSGQTAPWDSGPTCASGAPRQAFLRNPTSCTAPAGSSSSDGLTTTAHIDSWDNPGRRNPDDTPDLSDPRWKSASFVSHLPPSYPAAPDDRGPNQLPTGCEKVPFDPMLTAALPAPARTNTPTGFTFDLKLPQSDDPNAVGEGDLKKAVVTLPQGVHVAPGSADGLGACSEAQIALSSTGDASCPESSKVGSLTIKTPLLDDPLTGSIYLATPHQNKFGSLIAIYIVAKGPGVLVKLPGKVETDPNTGQLTATFDDNPQVPFSALHLEFKGGSRAPLVTPEQCGTYTTHAVLTSWSGKTVPSDSSFTLDQNSDGTPCSPPGFSPGFNAGTTDPIAGKDSPFVLSLTRGDRDQELSGLTVDMPTGLLGRIANTSLCPDAGAGNGTCEDVSRVGGVTVGAGAGANPFYITTGRAYITGPYKDAPYGLSIVVPAVAGPFDLGNVVVRAAIYIKRSTAALHVVSDPLPTVLEGIPLSVRDVRVAVDKPRFIVNPTSCAEKHVAATVTSTAGTVAHVASRFQALECANLSLAPKMTFSVGSRQHTKPGVSTPVTATLTQTPGQTNLRSVSVTLPGTLDALLPVVNRACKLAEFQTGRCGDKAKIGTAVAVTPLLRDPLKGSAYFVKNPARLLPDLMVALRGAVSLDLTGKVKIPGGKRLATQFDTIPDAPITKFSLRIVSGKNGPVGIATNLCGAKGRSTPAAVGFRGQNGRLLQVNQRLRIVGCPKAAKARKARGRR